MIETDIERLYEVPQIGRKRVEKIRENWERQKEIKNVMLFLQGYGVSTAYAAKIYREYGSESIDKVRENPYRLADDIWGIGFKTADGIAGPLTLKRLGVSLGAIPEANEANVNLLARIISAEARGEPYSGQVAVGAVILNRVEHPSFPDTLSGVIYQPGAFTAITDGQFNESVAESAYRAARDALNGTDPSGGAIYYYNPDRAISQWIRTRPVIKRIGKHLFCS